MTNAPLIWDLDITHSFSDATCDLQGIDLATGNPDDHFNFDAGALTVQLDNSSGKWSRYNFDGTQSGFGPGFHISLWARYRDTGEQWWMFDGRISRWDDFTNTVVIEAFDATSDLAQPIGTYTPGINGQQPGARMEAIITAAGRTAQPRRFVTGEVALTAQETDAAPLEEMQAVAASDGEVLFVDADGTLITLARNWRIGRPDQVDVPVASDNVCTVPVVVWDALLSVNDEALAQTVIFENVAKLRAIAPAGQAAPAGSVFTETDHQWTTQTEGDTLAAIVYGMHSDPRVNVEEFDLYLYDDRQPDLFRSVEWRLLDVLRFLHDQRAVGGINRLDINTLITTIAHSITPDTWIMSVRTSKAMAPNAVLIWNPSNDAYYWNASGAVWGF